MPCFPTNRKTFLTCLVLSVSLTTLIANQLEACPRSGRAVSHGYRTYSHNQYSHRNYVPVQQPVYRPSLAVAPSAVVTKPVFSRAAVAPSAQQAAAVQPAVRRVAAEGQALVGAQAAVGALPASNGATMPVSAPLPASQAGASQAGVAEPPAADPAPAPPASKVKSGSTIRIRANLPAETGRVVLKTGPVILNVEIKQWTTEAVVLSIPTLDLLRPTEASLFIVTNKAKPLADYDVILVPATAN